VLSPTPEAGFLLNLADSIIQDRIQMQPRAAPVPVRSERHLRLKPENPGRPYFSSNHHPDKPENHKFMNSTRFLPTIIFSLAGTLFLLGGCGSGHDHYSPIGLVLSIDGSMIASQEIDAVTYAEGDAIYVPAGESTATITVQFMDDDSSLFTPQRSGYELRYSVENTEVLGVTHPADEGPWSLLLEGLQPGVTTIQFDLWHGSHSDFTSVAFQVEVEETEND
jgi:hypothetical protein